MSINILYTTDGRRVTVDIPEQAVEAAEEWARNDVEIALANAAPFIIATAFRRAANDTDNPALATLLRHEATAMDGAR